MKSPLTRLVPFLIEETNRRRQAYAHTALDEGTLRKAMVEAAQRGEEALRVHLEMDIRGTPAANSLNEWTRKEGLYLSWEVRLNTKPDGQVESVHEPVLRWMEAKLT